MLLFSSLTTIILSLILILFNYRINKNALFLAFFFIIFSLYAFVHFATVHGENAFLLALMYNHFTPVMLLTGPFLLFYVRGTLTDNIKITWRDSFHFVPAFVHFIGIIPYLFMPFGEKIEIATQIIRNLDYIKQVKFNFIFSVNAAFFLRIALFVAYVFYCAYLVWQFSPEKEQKKNIPEQQFRVTYRWLVVFLTTLLIIAFNFGFITFEFINSNAAETMKRYSFIYNFTGFVFGCMSLLLIFFPQVLYGMPRYNPLGEQSSGHVEEKNILGSGTEAVQGSIPPSENEPFQALANRILNHFEKEKPFTNIEFSISDLASALDVPLNHITYSINNVLKTKFTALRMKYRVEYAKKLLSEGKQTVYTIENIAKLSGFATRSSFYIAFKSEAGMTPSEFSEKIQS